MAILLSPGARSAGPHFLPLNCSKPCYQGVQRLQTAVIADIIRAEEPGDLPEGHIDLRPKTRVAVPADTHTRHRRIATVCKWQTRVPLYVGSAATVL